MNIENEGLVHCYQAFCFRNENVTFPLGSINYQNYHKNYRNLQGLKKLKEEREDNVSILLEIYKVYKGFAWLENAKQVLGRAIPL